MRPFRSQQVNNEIPVEAIKAVPPVAASAAVASGWWSDPNHWVVAATLAYIALQSAYLVWKWVRQARNGIVEES